MRTANMSPQASSVAILHSPLGRGDHAVVGEVSGKVLRGFERALFFSARGYDLIHRKRSPFPSSGEGIIYFALLCEKVLPHYHQGRLLQFCPIVRLLCVKGAVCEGD